MRHEGGRKGATATSTAAAGYRRFVPLAADDPLPPDDLPSARSSQGVAELYRTHGRVLSGFLRRHVGGDRAPDLLHHLFSRFLRLSPEQRSKINCQEAYLKSAARNLVRDERKTAMRHAADRHVPEQDVALQAPCQIAALEARDMLCRIEQSIQKLKPLTRQIFLAHRLDGYSYGEIAQQTGLSVKGVEKHMSRAIAHIDRTLAER